MTSEQQRSPMVRTVMWAARNDQAFSRLPWAFARQTIDHRLRETILLFLHYTKVSNTWSCTEHAVKDKMHKARYVSDNTAIVNGQALPVFRRPAHLKPACLPKSPALLCPLKRLRSKLVILDKWAESGKASHSLGKDKPLLPASCAFPWPTYSLPWFQNSQLYDTRTRNRESFEQRPTLVKGWTNGEDRSYRSLESFEEL